MRSLLCSLPILILAPAMFAQNFDPPPLKTPDAATLKQVKTKKQELEKLIEQAVVKTPREAQGDLEIYGKALKWILEQQEYFTADIGKQMLAVADQGIKRCQLALAGKPSWVLQPGKCVPRGYRSRIDNSVQPYAVWYPAGYGQDPKKKYRIDIMLHGRDGSLTEVKFLNSHFDKNTAKDQEFVQIDIYGRGNNAYRWAGEVDVYEAFTNFTDVEKHQGRGDLIDFHRLVLKGFSMGGAGSWHIGLRRPAHFAVVQPGAGFTTTHGYISGLPAKLPEPLEEMLTIYDAVNYASNAFNVPIVAYSGEIDKQRQAAVNIEERLKTLKLSEHMTHFVAPGLEHKFPPDWVKKVEGKLQEFVGVGKENPLMPKAVNFTTFTLAQADCNWVKIFGLEQHYKEANVTGTWDGKTFNVTTKNVRKLRLTNHHFDGETAFPNEVTIDGKAISTLKLKVTPAAEFEKTPNGWVLWDSNNQAKAIEKKPHRQGPIDDAFMDRFVCVVGTGTPLNPKMHAAAMEQLERFKKEWRQWMRGELLVIKDTEVTPELMRDKNLVLFGDPGSNQVISQMLPKLPLKWNAKLIELADNTYDAATHLPMLIHLNPEVPTEYIVINSGHTFHTAEFKGTNAQLYPRLGDYAVVKPTPTAKEPAAFEVVLNGLFDEFWKPRKAK